MSTIHQNFDGAALRDKAAAIETYLDERMISASGVVYTHLNAETDHPWRREDWRPEYDFLDIPDTTPWDVLNFENCGMVTGAYLAAMTFKYRATQSQEALAQADRAFAGLAHIFQIGRQKEPGFFPKIYGGRYTEQTSSDQYLYAMKGMLLYHEIAADSQRREIETMVDAMAEFWRKRTYRYGYYTIPDMAWPIGRFPSFMIMAYALTKKPKYRSEFDRLHREHGVHLRPADSILADRAARPEFSLFEEQMGRRYLLGALEECAAMGIMSLDECLKHSDTHRDNWLETMRQLWREGLLALASEGMSYSQLLYDPQTQVVSAIPEPGYEPAAGEEGADSLRWNFFRWRGNILSPRSAMLARAGLNVSRWLPEEEARSVAKKILSDLKIENMRESIDIDGRQLHPSHRFLSQSICGDALTNWLWAYWEGIAS